MGNEIYEAVRRGATLQEIYDVAIKKYEGEVKGFQIMLIQEAELSGIEESVKIKNIASWKRMIRKAKYNLTRAKNLRKALINENRRKK